MTLIDENTNSELCIFGVLQKNWVKITHPRCSHTLNNRDEWDKYPFMASLMVSLDLGVYIEGAYKDWCGPRLC